MVSGRSLVAHCMQAGRASARCQPQPQSTSLHTSPVGFCAHSPQKALPAWDSYITEGLCRLCLKPGMRCWLVRPQLHARRRRCSTRRASMRPRWAACLRRRRAQHSSTRVATWPSRAARSACARPFWPPLDAWPTPMARPPRAWCAPSARQRGPGCRSVVIWLPCRPLQGGIGPVVFVPVRTCCCVLDRVADADSAAAAAAETHAPCDRGHNTFGRSRYCWTSAPLDEACTEATSQVLRLRLQLKRTLPAQPPTRADLLCEGVCREHVSLAFRRP